MKLYLKEHSDMARDIEARILEHYGLQKKGKVEAKADAKAEKKGK